jgi:hypothetical protein
MNMMSPIYAKLVKEKLKTIEEVPEHLREEVQVILSAEEA